MAQVSQHLQVMTANLLQKRWEWQEERAPRLKHGSVIRPTLCLASLDIKTAFDEARPRHVAKSTENHYRHGWLIAASSERCPGLRERRCSNV